MTTLLVSTMIIVALTLALFDLHRWKCSVCKNLQVNASEPSDMWIRVSNLNIDQLSLVADDLKAHVDLSLKVSNLISINVNAGVAVKKVNLSSAGKIRT